MTSLSGIFLPSFSPGMLRWGEVNIMVKRSKLILIGALLATILVIIEIVIYGGLAGQTPADPETAEEVGTAIGTTIGLMLVLPHVVLFALGCLFNWLGWFTKIRGFTLTAGILYCVSLIAGVQNFYMVLIPLILAFVGFARQGKRTQKTND